MHRQVNWTQSLVWQVVGYSLLHSQKKLLRELHVVKRECQINLHVDAVSLKH
jgi:hypothetical protein